jgi:anti-sigma B factor antagonist
MPSSVVLSPPPRTHGGLTVRDAGHDRAHVLVLAGELDSDSISTLEDAISDCCHHGPTTITLDLSKLAFIDSAGLWTITIARKWCESHGHGFWLIPGPEHVQYVFEVTGLSDVLPFKKDGSKRS